MKRLFIRPKRIVPVLLVAALYLYSCGNSGREIKDTDRKTVLENTGRKVILPAFRDFEVRTDSLEAAVRKFTENPSENTLTAARESWRRTAAAWKNATVFTFGPVEDQFLSGAIDYGSVHYPNIEKAILTADKIDSDYITSKGSSLKGLKAIEYLLFHESSGQVADRFRSAHGAQRKAYLLSLCVNLRANAGAVVKAWDPSEGNYLGTFVNADGKDINASLGILVNKMISQVNMIRDESIGAPLGKRSQGQVQPGLMEGRLSNTSRELLVHQIKSVENGFSAGDSTGINRLLDQLDARYQDELLSKRISEQFRELYRLCDRVNSGTNLTSPEEVASLNALYDALKQLQVLIQVDLVNQLGILLTFSDNDGD